MRILCWNRNSDTDWPIDEYLRQKSRIEKSGSTLTDTWSVNRQKDIEIGETVYLLAQGGKHPRGIVARGVITRRPFTGPHRGIQGKLSNYVGVAWQQLCDPALPLGHDDLVGIDGVNWQAGFQSSGNRIPQKSEAQLDALWEDHIAVADTSSLLPEEWLARHSDLQIQYAGELWPYLVELASLGGVWTYADIAAPSGVPLRWVGRGLGPIQDYCDSEALPPLTVLIVNARTRRPGKGSRYRDSFERQLLRVHGFDWKSVANPFAEDSELLDDLVLREIEAKPISPARKKQIVLARVGQGEFRKKVMARRGSCAVTGISDYRVLIASHIRPWAKCESDEQRLDPDNGLMLTPDVDKLFDSGLLTFENNGVVRVSKQLDRATLRALGIDLPLRVKPFPQAQHKYLKYHRENEFEKKLNRK